ncbi:biotin/lipoyl-containing protein [Maribacter sp. 2308TA10-17]|uniref:biotin/lipoyl-containing protein n=1 Tax=Maribacter sp. 2308TA10-17 TaxID=3386276 RepID=UPI0039BD4425
MTNYLVTIDNKEIALKKEDVEALDSISIDGENYHILEKSKAYEASLVSADFLNKALTVAVNGNSYQVKIEDEYDQQVRKMGLLAVTAQKVNSIKAPMPGLIVDILVEVGQEISEGTPLLVLSAMKMENIITSQGDGVVKSIEVKKDAAVEKGQLIIEME